MRIPTRTRNGPRVVVHPRALVVVESMFGNTDQIARSVAAGLTREGVDTQVVGVDAAPTRVDHEVDLVVLGAPTHVFSLSRPRTRADAVRQGARPERAARGMRDWLAEAVPGDPGHPPLVVAFDTRVARPRLLLPHTAGRRALALAEECGFEVDAAPQSFLVDDVAGPVSDGESDDALAWGRRLGHNARTHAVTRRRGELAGTEAGS